MSVVILLLLMYMNQLFTGPTPKAVLSLWIWCSYSIILFIPKRSWTQPRLILAFITIIAENAAGLYWFHENKLIYFLGMVILITAVQLPLARSMIPVMAAILAMGVLYILYGSGDYTSLVSSVLLPFILYFAIRNRMQRNEMHALNKQHLTELQEAYDQLQEASVTTMQYAVMEERTRIARDMHDAVGHSLTSLIVQMQALKYMVKQDPQQSAASVDAMLVVARQGLHDIRTSVHALADNRTASGLIPLKSLLSRMEAEVRISYEFHSNLGDEDINAEVSGLLYRVLQEAITNMIRHSNATKVEVSLRTAMGKIIMAVRDNGALESHQQIKEGFGLSVMKARLEERGGELRYAIAEPNGFEIVAEIGMEM